MKKFISCREGGLMSRNADSKTTTKLVELLFVDWILAAAF